jgi:hypothetical protein
VQRLHTVEEGTSDSGTDNLFVLLVGLYNPAYFILIIYIIQFI